MKENTNRTSLRDESNEAVNVPETKHWSYSWALGGIPS